jgi:hypothetical protein
MSVDYMMWGRGISYTSYDFQKADEFDNERRKVLNSRFMFLLFYSDEEFVENKPSM